MSGSAPLVELLPAGRPLAGGAWGGRRAHPASRVFMARSLRLPCKSGVSFVGTRPGQFQPGSLVASSPPVSNTAVRVPPAFTGKVIVSVRASDTATFATCEIGTSEP